jgi:hypothetical protein
VTPGMLASNVETSGGTNITAHRYRRRAVDGASRASGLVYPIHPATRKINPGRSSPGRFTTFRTSRRVMGVSRTNPRIWYGEPTRPWISSIPDPII